MFRVSLLIGALALLAWPAAAEEPSIDVGNSIAKIRIFATSRGDRLWAGYGEAPFEFLLIDGGKEELLCRASMPSGFTREGSDQKSGCVRYVRSPSALPDTLLAAMPLFGPPSTIVMGTPKSTGRSAADWTRTILHEHFHQWQDALPRFYERAAALELDDSGGKSGMWMLNYPFPYSDPQVVARFRLACGALGAALDARGKPGFRAALVRYLAARAALHRAAGDRNWRYAEFELWREGVAQWTEIELGKRFPDPLVRSSAIALERRSRLWLDNPELKSAGREFVYPIGSGEAMLLDACGSGWRKAYPQLLSLGPLLQDAVRHCR